MSAAIFVASQVDSGVSFDNDVFDSSQYLFAQQNTITTSIGLSIMEGSILSAVAPPFLVDGRTLGAIVGAEPVLRREVIRYTAEEGDTLSSVAQKFNISLGTLLLANNLSNQSVLYIGKELTILPVSGVMHVVSERDTVSEIAQIYQAQAIDIIEFNLLGESGAIYAGDMLVIPGGKRPKIVQRYTQVPLSQSYLICPVPSPCRITQSLHWYNAVDFSNGKCGEPVFAAASGNVQRTGYTNTGGNYVRIAHPNGVVTYYGHLSKSTVSPGANVYQGQIIGYIGHTGKTIPDGPSGCHTHFDVRFATNPFGVYSVGAKLGQ